VPAASGAGHPGRRPLVCRSGGLLQFLLSSGTHTPVFTPQPPDLEDPCEPYWYSDPYHPDDPPTPAPRTLSVLDRNYTPVWTFVAFADASSSSAPLYLAAADQYARGFKCDACDPRNAPCPDHCEFLWHSLSRGTEWRVIELDTEVGDLLQFFNPSRPSTFPPLSPRRCLVLATAVSAHLKCTLDPPRTPETHSTQEWGLRVPDPLLLDVACAFLARSVCLSALILACASYPPPPLPPPLPTPPHSQPRSRISPSMSRKCKRDTARHIPSRAYHATSGGAAQRCPCNKRNPPLSSVLIFCFSRAITSQGVRQPCTRVAITAVLCTQRKKMWAHCQWLQKGTPSSCTRPWPADESSHRFGPELAEVRPKGSSTAPRRTPSTGGSHSPCRPRVPRASPRRAASA